MIRILIADDHAIVRAGLRQFIADQVDMEVTAEAASGSETVSAVRAAAVSQCAAQTVLIASRSLVMRRTLLLVLTLGFAVAMVQAQRGSPRGESMDRHRQVPPEWARTLPGTSSLRVRKGHCGCSFVRQARRSA